MALSFIGVTLMTAVAAWIPEFWMIRSSWENETWARVGQGQRAARALYTSWESEVANAALLAAQLPTLLTLTTERQTAALTDYLHTVEESLDLDLVLVCDENGQPLAQTGGTALEEVCTLNSHTKYTVARAPGEPVAWLLSERQIAQPPPASGRAAPLGSVVAGLRLDDQFARAMRNQTGLEHTLLVDGEPISTSFPSGRVYWAAVTQRSTLAAGEDGRERTTFRWNGTPYYAVHLPLNDSVLVDEVALAAEELAATQRMVLRTGLLSVALAVVASSLVGILAARRIDSPLVRLTLAASRFSEGDLASPISVRTEVEEVRVVAQTLEQARADLHQTLGQLQAEKAWVEDLLQAIVEGIMTLDANHHITFFSRGAERLTGWSRDEVLQHHCDEVFLLVGSERQFSDLIPETGERRRVWVRLADGRASALSLTRAELAPPEAGGAWAALVFRDVSEEEAVQQLMSHFLANVTHEFRTPLTALGASTELLLDQSAGLTEVELNRMLTWIHLGILSLQTLVDNLLEATSLEAGRFRVRPHPTDLGEIIGEATRVMQPLLEKYNQRLKVEMPPAIPLVHADGRRIVQVLVNLLSNANKYGPDDSEILLQVSRVGETIRLAVSDRGPGIPAEVQGSVFQRFAHFVTHSDSDKSRYGIGLGLWVVKAIVEGHGGEVGVAERPGGGATFWFSLPLRGTP